MKIFFSSRSKARAFHKIYKGIYGCKVVDNGSESVKNKRFSVMLTKGV